MTRKSSYVGPETVIASVEDAVIAVDLAQRVVLYNHGAERIFGWGAQEMIGQPLKRLLPERFHETHAEYVNSFSAADANTRRMGEGKVVYGMRKNGEEFAVDASISQTTTPEGRLFTVRLREASESSESDLEKVRLAARLSGLLETAMDGIISMDASQRIVLYNTSAETIFGWPTAQVLGRPLDMLIPSRFRFSHWEQVRRFGETGVTSRRARGHSLVFGLRVLVPMQT